MKKYQEALDWFLKTVKAYEDLYPFNKKGRHCFLIHRNTLQELINNCQQPKTCKGCTRKGYDEYSGLMCCPETDGVKDDMEACEHWSDNLECPEWLKEQPTKTLEELEFECWGNHNSFVHEEKNIQITFRKTKVHI